MSTWAPRSEFGPEYGSTTPTLTVSARAGAATPKASTVAAHAAIIFIAVLLGFASLVSRSPTRRVLRAAQLCDGICCTFARQFQDGKSAQGPKGPRSVAACQRVCRVPRPPAQSKISMCLSEIAQDVAWRTARPCARPLARFGAVQFRPRIRRGEEKFNLPVDRRNKRRGRAFASWLRRCSVVRGKATHWVCVRGSGMASAELCVFGHFPTRSASDHHRFCLSVADVARCAPRLAGFGGLHATRVFAANLFRAIPFGHRRRDGEWREWFRRHGVA